MAEQDNTTPAATQARVTEAAKRKGQREVEKKARALKTLTVTYLGINDLSPNPYNPNRQSDHEFELLMRSMQEDGFTQPIVAVRMTEEFVRDARFKDYTVGQVVITDGEHRWRAASTLGYEEVPVVITDMSPEQMRIATLRHNRARGSEDIELAANVLKDLQSLGAIEWAQDSLMLDDLELNRLLDDITAPEALANEEYTEGWNPSDTAHEQTTKAVVTDEGRATSGMTPGAMEAARKREEALKSARTQEDRERALKDNAIFRVSLVFNGEEAELVRSVLGDEPAVRLVQLCRDAEGAEEVSA